MFDPEIPVNIWELGLIYDVVVDAAGVAGIRMTLTAPGCPAAQSLPVEVAQQGQGGARRHRREGRRRLGAAVDEGPDVGRGEAATGDVVSSLMLRLSKKADYALMAMKHLATRPDAASASAREIAEQYDIPDRADGQGAAAAGAARPADVAPGHARRLPPGARRRRAISVADIIQAIDGPLTVTACSTEAENCGQYCEVQRPRSAVADQGPDPRRRWRPARCRRSPPIRRRAAEHAARRSTAAQAHR